jgi:glycosyltransferase involved in cell wall biosynthesis
MRRADVVLVCQRGVQVDAAVKYGAARATVEIARALRAAGRAPLLVGLSTRTEGETEGLPFVAAADEAGVLELLRRLAPVDALIGCSRADIFLAAAAKARLVYHHGPHLPDGEFSRRIIERLRIPVVVVSEDSRRLQARQGVPPELLRLVRNGYDAGVFAPSDAGQRRPHRLVFAGLGVPYKGLDIAVAAFALLRSRFPDAEFRIYGSHHDWEHVRGPTHWRAEWLDRDGSPDWASIEAALPGLAYRGPVEPRVLARGFQRASLLVMPSRVEETFGMVSIEAQACGCLPVLPDRGGFPETMQAGITGYTYLPNTPEELARCIDALWSRELPTAEQREAASRWVATQFSWTHAAHRIAEVLDEQVPRDPALWPLEASAWRVATSVKERLRHARSRLAHLRPGHA